LSLLLEKVLVVLMLNGIILFIMGKNKVKDRFKINWNWDHGDNNPVCWGILIYYILLFWFYKEVFWKD